MQVLAAAAIVSFAIHGGVVGFKLDRGSAELRWRGDSTFRFRRVLEGALPGVSEMETPQAALHVDDTPGAVVIRSKFIEVSVAKRGALVRVRKLDGTPLAADLTEPEPAPGGVTWARRASPGTAYYGLGARVDPSLDLRGKSVQAATPFLIADTGYGEFHPGGGAFSFDFTAADRYRIEAPRVDYFFYYGPSVKQVFEEHHTAQGTPEDPPPPAFVEGAGSWAGLAASLLRRVHGAMSAEPEGRLDLAVYENAPEELRTRARQLGSLAPDALPGATGLSGFREKLASFFAVYAVEKRDRGYPVWHPLPFQFSADPECARHADEFMLGDEMLIAPVVAPGGRRSVYLPQGIWTNLDTDEVFVGRRSIEVRTAALPVFARNGTIVPLDSAGGMTLHYFPKLGAEFFVLEAGVSDYSQFHAAPAADAMRLEIESKVERDYRWVVHHTAKPRAVEWAGAVFKEAASAPVMADHTWFFDAARQSLEVRVRVKAGEDSIVNIGF